MRIYGWGRNSFSDSQITTPDNPEEIIDCINAKNNIITRGLGRSYGDSANNFEILNTRNLKKIFFFDKIKGIIKCESGISLRELNEITIKEGWFVNVTPGSSFVTIGGCIASDIHGKNHHLDGTFCNHLISVEIILGNGQMIEISDIKNKELFYATCGGIGLTGIIYSATIKLRKINSTLINQKTIVAKSLEETLNVFDSYFSSKYSVAWVDLFSNKNNYGKSIIFLGQHDEKSFIKSIPKEPIKVPAKLLSYFLNNQSMRIFNTIYFYKNYLQKKIKKINLYSYFYPLDSLSNWNMIYGKKGFIQYQFVIPKKNGPNNLKKIFDIIYKFDIFPYLTTLKMFGKENLNYLSFPIEGYSVALDFKNNKNLIYMTRALDDLIIASGGKIYLTKDSLMSENCFKNCYPKWKDFQNIRKKFHAYGKFSSDQSRRLGLE